MVESSVCVYLCIILERVNSQENKGHSIYSMTEGDGPGNESFINRRGGERGR